MDRTLKRAKGRNRRRNSRNYTAWQRFSPDGATCRYCPHDNTRHLCQSGQPHFYRKATEAEERDPSVTLYRYNPRIEYGAGSAGGRLDAGAAHRRRQARRARHRILHGLRRGHEPRTRCSATSATWRSVRRSGCGPATRT